MDYLQLLLGVLGGTTAAIAILKIYGKSLIDHLLASDIENHKAKLNEQTKCSVEKIKSELEESKSLNTARRDYEYEARKRLYREYEPLLFLFVVTAADALHRIHSLARWSRKEGIREDGTGWLEGKTYCLSSTIYYLLAPLAIFKLIQRRQTLMDLQLDPCILSHYTIARCIYISYSDDFDFAKAYPSLDYSPNCLEWERKRNTDPAVYWRQGLPVGRLDSALESMIVQNDECQRIMSFGEFEMAYFNPISDLSAAFETVTDVFAGFHPKTRPVLWRILIAQSYMFSAFTQQQFSTNKTTPWIVESLDSKERLDWRVSDQDADEKLALVQPFAVAEEYLEERLKDYIYFAVTMDEVGNIR